jgi:sporulation protein YlmC with PRC-barrel domain
MDIPINAEVFAADGSYGRSTRVILNPVTEQVTHLVVKEATFGVERLVPLQMVKESTPTVIRLNGSKSELEKLPPMTITEYLQPVIPFNQYGIDQYVMWPYTVPGLTDIPLEHDMVPPDELAVRRGTRVEATDGHVGRVSEFVVSPTNGHISHLVLEEGPFWSKKDVAIPIAQVDRIEKDTVYLKLDKQALEALPTIPIHRGMQSHP